MLKQIDPEAKKRIDKMSYKDMLQLNRFASPNESLLRGMEGIYFYERMSLEKINVGQVEHVRISKKIGWRNE